ncbi:MAG: shikimate kinase [Tannerella sp.]|jgi:shikimate kinase|nr:shikimate kinase [Tannerella sp.]
MQRIFLLGYMGAGKTTTGREFSAQTGLSFIDLDVFIENRYHKTIRQIFEEQGEAAFRETERKALREVAGIENAVISTGGGTPCFFDNMAFMNAAGTTVYLKVSVDELALRLEASKNSRPMLKNLSGEALKQFISNTLSERSIFYEQAKIIFAAERMMNGNDVGDLCRQLYAKVEDFARRETGKR